MSVVNDVLEQVIALAEQTSPYAAILIGALPANDGLSIAIGTGSATSIFFDKGSEYEIDCVLNGKHKDAEIVSDTLNDIHQYLTQLTSYPETQSYQITSIETIASPNYLDRDDRGQILYGSSLRIKFYFKKGALNELTHNA